MISRARTRRLRIVRASCSDPAGYPTKSLGSYHVLPTTTWMDPPSPGDPRRWGAPLNNGAVDVVLPPDNPTRTGRPAGGLPCAEMQRDTWLTRDTVSGRATCRRKSSEDSGRGSPMDPSAIIEVVRTSEPALISRHHLAL